jgi:hypothetical protein
MTSEPGFQGRVHFLVRIGAVVVNAPWLDEFVSELLSFPGRHDDQVDALTQGLAWRLSARSPPRSAHSSCRRTDSFRARRIGGERYGKRGRAVAHRSTRSAQQ